MHSFFSKKESSASDATDLSMKEMILGVMQSKDGLHSGMLHASDFRQAVSQLGIPMGHHAVEEVLMHCKVSAEDGRIDYSGLESELGRQRKRLNEELDRKRQAKKQFQQSSQAANTSSPFQKRGEQESRVKKEEYALSINAHRSEIHDIFRDYSNHQLSPEEVVMHLSAYGIKPNRRFELLVEDHRSSDDLSFREFFCALSVYNPSETVLTDRAAGGKTVARDSFQINPFNESNSEQLFQRQIKRNNIMAQKLQQDRSNADGVGKIGGRRDKLFVDSNPSGDSAIYKNSDKIKDALQFDDCGPANAMITHNKAQMLQGVSGESPTIKYNVEMKMTREQVLAALRRLDANVISLSDFERKLFDIGIDLDPLIFKRIQDSLKTGKLDWKTVVTTLDATVFQKRAMESRPSPELVQDIKDRVTACLKEIGGVSGLGTLSSLFYRIDEDKNGVLSYNEYTNACRLFGLSERVSSEDLRILFHELDINGDGELDIYEFVNGLRGKLTGTRLHLVRDSFNTIDTKNDREVPIDTIVQNMNFDLHPDVILEVRTARQAQTDFIQFISSRAGSESQITFEVFSDYWANVSFAINDEEEFSMCVKSVCGLGDLAPPPALVQASRTSELKGREVASRAVQVHGDIVSWSQEASDMEKQSRSTFRLYKRQAPETNSKTSGINVYDMNGTYGQSKTREEAVDEQKLTGMRYGNQSSNIFKWDTTTKGILKAKERAREHWERKMHMATNANGLDPADGTKTSIGAFELGETERMAGQPSILTPKGNLPNKRATVATAARRNFGGPSPFALDDKESNNVRGKNGVASAGGEQEAKPVSRPLSALIKEKKLNSGAKSLLDLMEGK